MNTIIDSKSLSLAIVLSIAVLAAGSAAARDWFGEPGEASSSAHDVASVMAEPRKWQGQRLAVRGRITDVCTNRGCWAVFESDGEMLRIVARDHAFAIPDHARGPAVAHGVFERHELDPDKVEHMVEEDGADADLLDDPVSYRLVADGVALDP